MMEAREKATQHLSVLHHLDVLVHSAPAPLVLRQIPLAL